MESTVFFVIIITIILAVFLWKRKKHSWKKPDGKFPAEWRKILVKNVLYYNALNSKEKEEFEFRVNEFLLNCRITGIKTTVDTTDKLLVAASAIIPVFKFPEWRYTNISEVLLYPSMFNDNFETNHETSNIMGMVGTGFMEGKMILSKSALRHGFNNESDKKNTAIHEFIHLIDKTDGAVDGIPELLLEKQYAIPWIDLINKKIDEIFEGKSDINPYGGTNKAEFFSVASEYFFEKPKLLSRKHPELYRLLEQIFKQDMNTRNLRKRSQKIGRNSPCPCNSGLKFKKCCGRVHYN